LLTRNSRKNFYPEGAPRLKDLSSYPARMLILSESEAADALPQAWALRFDEPLLAQECKQGDGDGENQGANKNA
jgi:hypothetical protein